MNEDGSMSAEEYLRRAEEMPPPIPWRRPDTTTMAHKTQALRKLFQKAVDCDPADMTPDGLPDLVLNHVHLLPTRAICRAITATPPMMAQQASGQYPTIADHVARRTPAFLSNIDDFGQITFRQLTPEEEHAIRTHTDQVQESKEAHP